MRDGGGGGGRAVPGGIAETSQPGGIRETARAGPGARRRLAGPAAVVAVLVLLAGGFCWLFRGELLHPFGDGRACGGSDTELPAVISAGGAPIPADASEIHYVTGDGRAQVSFRSDRMPGYLHRTGLVPEGKPLLDGGFGGAYALGEGESELPEGLCGPALRGPAWSYRTAGPGPVVDVLVERSSLTHDTLRSPARVVVSFGIG
ncbi:hypothetical protein [Streptomyces sp. NBC_00859]|uniref:hypothetical protein n=1 Tax=Streptomyces sp. NBC_00859 TaxID=2903682 RepID=UPI00386925C4|nr:hypothetical protein OG584_20615 [Streptomyces sp. NBC_00859]